MNTSNSSRWSDRLLIGLFALALSLPILDSCFRFDPTSPPSENRVLADFPPLPGNRGDLKNYLSESELYFNDHFGCRRVLIMWHKKLKWSLFRQKNLRNDVLVGTDGWLFISGAGMIEHFRGALPFTELELNDWRKLLEHRRDWLAARGIKYLFVIAPDKQSIYPEYLPTWLKNLGGRTRLDQFLDYMHAHSTVEVLDLRPALLAVKKSAPVYLQTDTHWNELGAFVACEEIVRTLAVHQMPGLVPVSLSAFDQSNPITTGGDLTRFLDVSMVESNAMVLTPGSTLPRLNIFEPTGRQGKERAFAKNSQGHGRAMVYDDSFGNFWVPFLGYQFGEADFFPQSHFDAAEIERQKPVVVIDEVVERFFNVADPKELSRLDALP
jgi:hypothetical protein